ncbi:MAG TPA: M23 family peptidase, partial [Bacteroidia bacterium]
MSKIKYKFNTKSLTYEKVEVSWKQRILQLLSYLATGTVFAAITIFFAYKFFPSPQQKILERENEQLKTEYDILNQRLANISAVLAD